ncbi:MAG: rod shape-determining protein RodA [Polyangiales bacterium]
MTNQLGRYPGSAVRARERIDWPLLVSVLLIAVIGVVNLYSATSVAHGGRADLYVTQIYWLVAGGIAATAAAAIDYRHFERLGYVIYAGGILLLLLVLILGRDIHGAARWIDIGGKDKGFRFQPSEFMKIFLAIALAKYLHDDPKVPIGPGGGGRTIKDLVVPTVIAGIPFALVAKQPDLGTSLIILGIFVSVMALGKMRWRSLATLAISFGVAAPLVWTYVLQPYQKTRVLSVINPELDIRGSGWHAHHARVAIGDGGLFGAGFLRGTQNHYLFIPEQHSDFPFPVFAEEWGFAGALFLVVLYALLVLWGIRIASQAKDRFGAALAIGISAMIFWHAFFNIGMVCGVLPVVGVTLPLFSYGGSSVTTILIGVGLLMNVSVRRFSFG